MSETENSPKETLSFSAIRVIVQKLKGLTLPTLFCPERPTPEFGQRELLNWGVTVYCYSWLREIDSLTNAVVLLTETHNDVAPVVIARSIYEFCAHAYYVKKHLKQHLDTGDVKAAWDFIFPISTGSRYMKERFPEESEMFPTSVHIGKVIRCFSEVIPEDVRDSYSYLSEFCHPNMLAFSQHYLFEGRETHFVEHPPRSVFGAIAGSCINAFQAIHEILLLADEKTASKFVKVLLVEIVRDAYGDDWARSAAAQ